MIFNTLVSGGSSKLFKGLVDGSITEIKEGDLKGITHIRDKAFTFCYNLTSIVIPDNVTVIMDEAFYGCDDLTSVTLLATTPPSIGVDVFDQTNEDLVIYVPKEKVKEYRESWGQYIDKIQYKFTEGLAYAYSDDFEGYQVVGMGAATDTDIVIRDTFNGTPVVRVESYVFKGNDSLTSVYIPDSVREIGQESFMECDNLKSVVIGAGVTHIGSSAFAQCTKLEHIQSNTLSYKSIDGNLYSDDEITLIQYAIGKTEKSFTVPDGVETIGEDAFAFCENLTNIVLPDGLYDIGESAFARCDNLISINIPDGVDRIADQGFYGCGSLQNIVLPSSLCVIEWHAFAHSYRLKSVIIYGDNLTEIGGWAFSGCDSLTDFTCYNPDPPTLGKEAFKDCSALSNIYVPAESVEAYKSATNWSAYADQIQAIVA